MAKEKTLLIVFLGPVGSGKSTHMRILEKWFLRRGYRVKRFFIKSFHLFSYLLLDIFLSRIICNILFSRSCKRWEIFLRLYGTSFLCFLVVFDAFISLTLVLLMLKFVIKQYKAVLIEEYLYGSLADYLYFLSRAKCNPMFSRQVVAYLVKLLNSLPPALVFYLDADIDTLKQRWIERGSDIERREYLEVQRSLLPVIVGLTGARRVYVDTANKTIEEVNRVLRAYIARLL